MPRRRGAGGAVGPELSGVGAQVPEGGADHVGPLPVAADLLGLRADRRSRRPTAGSITGILKAETPEAIEIEDADAKRIKIAKADIDGRKPSDVSLMPNGLAEGLTPTDFADLIAYLETLKDTAALHAPRRRQARPRTVADRRAAVENRRPGAAVGLAARPSFVAEGPGPLAVASRSSPPQTSTSPDDPRAGRYDGRPVTRRPQD